MRENALQSTFSRSPALTITITPETEAKLREMAAREGQDMNTIADVLLASAIEWEAAERAEAIEGITRGLEASAAGRVRPAAEVFADMRAKLKAGA